MDVYLGDNRVIPVIADGEDPHRVGVHDFTFEACSGFTRVTACKFLAHHLWAGPPPQICTVWGALGDQFYIALMLLVQALFKASHSRLLTAVNLEITYGSLDSGVAGFLDDVSALIVSWDGLSGASARPASPFNECPSCGKTNIEIDIIPAPLPPLE